MIALFVLSLVCFEAYHVSCAEYFVPKNVDIDEIIKNDRLTRNYLDCVLEKGKCTSEGDQLKKAIPEILQNQCAKCSEKHRASVKKVLHHLIENKPGWWKEVEVKFDPKGEYKKKYGDYLRQEGLVY